MGLVWPVTLVCRLALDVSLSSKVHLPGRKWREGVVYFSVAADWHFIIFIFPMDLCVALALLELVL